MASVLRWTGVDVRELSTAAARRLLQTDDDTSEEDDEGGLIVTILVVLVLTYVLWRLLRASIKIVRHSEGTLPPHSLVLCACCAARCSVYGPNSRDSHLARRGAGWAKQSWSSSGWGGTRPRSSLGSMPSSLLLSSPVRSTGGTLTRRCGAVLCCHRCRGNPATQLCCNLDRAYPQRNASHVDVVSVITERVDMREHGTDPWRCCWQACCRRWSWRSPIHLCARSTRACADQ